MKESVRKKAMTSLTNEQKTDLQNRLRKLKRFELFWEQMNETKNGEYVRFDDVMMLLVNFNRASFRESKTAKPTENENI